MVICKEQLLDKIKVVGYVCSRYNLQREKVKSIKASYGKAMLYVCNEIDELILLNNMELAQNQLPPQADACFTYLAAPTL